MKKRVFWIIGIGIVALVAFLVFNNSQKARQAMSEAFQTAQVERGELVAIVGATGTVRANQSAVLTWQTSGRIDEITVQVDEAVSPDQVLAELAKDSLPQSVILAEAELVEARRALENLKDSNLTSAQAALTLAQAQQAYEDALEDRQSQSFGRASQNTIDGLRAEYVLAKNALDDAETFFTAFEDRAEDDPNRAEALSVLVNARKRADRALANLNYALGMPDSNEVAEAEARVTLAKAQLEDAQREWERLKDGADPEDIAAAEARVAAVEASLNYRYLKAPFEGTVTEVNSKEGDQVSPGTASIRVDDLSRMLVEVRIPEVDINRVVIGDEVRLSFDAIRDQEYLGKVTEIARVGTTTQSGVDFAVTIELVDMDPQVRPGMTAAVNIVVEKLENVLLVPNRAVRFRDGKRVVYVQNAAGTLDPIDVQIGSSSELYSEITGGDLEEGDVVVLNPPAEFQPPQGGPMNRE
ncbi:MAG: efflux RND transporter periplasmic adaptor subunit [Chloroflexi bacterium]|nr:efflux RND transporter periplasmic adaptor subunit [Chloroflexota bacterium]